MPKTIEEIGTQEFVGRSLWSQDRNNIKDNFPSFPSTSGC